MRRFILVDGLAVGCALLCAWAAIACSDKAKGDSDGDAAAGGQPTTSTGGNNAGGDEGSGGASQGNGGAKSSSGGKSAGGAKGSGGAKANGAGGATGTGGGSATGGSTGTGGTTSTGKSTAAAIAAKLGKKNFIIGMGNDLNNNHDMDGAYTLGVTLDVHYAYLVGLMGKGGWPDWNAGGTFVDGLTKAATDHGVVSMMTLYVMGLLYETGNGAALTDDTYMRPYWDGAKLMYQRLATFDAPSMVQLEPDWWAYAQQQSPGGDPTKLAVHVTTLAPDCASLPNNMVGMGKCLVALARKYSPKTIVGFHASSWADGDPAKIVAYLSQIGATDGDFLTTDMLDRDAGCYEAHTDPNCQRTSSGVYFDETNQTSPNFHENLAWVKQITDGIGKPMFWWQVPLGVPSTTPGGTAGHYRDNRVHYIFSHIDEFIAAGGVGALFGTGKENQTDITTDGGQFKNAVTKYFAAPVPLP